MKSSPFLSRRALLKSGGFAALLGAPIPFEQFAGPNWAPVALAQNDLTQIRDKPDLRILSDRPVNIEALPHLLDGDTTPAERVFVRNNGQVRAISQVADADWILQIDGEVERPLELSLADLKSRFETVTLALQMECGGNGRRYFSPGASGNQWTFGAIACPQWTGVRLREVLNAAGLKPSAVYTGHFGADPHLTGDPEKQAISRGMPIEKALDPHTLLAWAIDDQPLPHLNGYPLRLVVPGWPGSCSHKWLTRIWVRDRVHDGAKMGGQSYRVPRYPVAPGTEVADADMEIIESMPVKSLVTFPQTGQRRDIGQAFEVRGHAWAGERAVNSMDISIDFGATWHSAELSPAVNKFAWQRWRADIVLPQRGYYEVWARATDDMGHMQPANPPGWNPRGYLNNMQHRIAVFAV